MDTFQYEMSMKCIFTFINFQNVYFHGIAHSAMLIKVKTEKLQTPCDWVHFYNATTKLPCCNIQQQLSLVLNTLTMTIPMVPPPILSTRVKSASVPAFSSWVFRQNWNPSWIHNEFNVNKALLSEECFFAIVYLINERLPWQACVEKGKGWSIKHYI